VQDIPFKGMSSVTYFLQGVPTSFVPHSIDATKSRTHQWIDPFMKSEPLQFSHFPKPPPNMAPATKPSAQELSGDSPDTNHSRAVPSLPEH
jgi:hypothetical protein